MRGGENGKRRRPRKRPSAPIEADHGSHGFDGWKCHRPSPIRYIRAIRGPFLHLTNEIPLSTTSAAIWNFWSRSACPAEVPRITKMGAHHLCPAEAADRASLPVVESPQGIDARRFSFSFEDWSRTALPLLRILVCPERAEYVGFASLFLHPSSNRSEICIRSF
jgi:hypothetical protein